MLDSEMTREEFRQAFETAKSAVEGNQVGQPWTPELVVTLSISVMMFGLIVLILMTFLYSRDKGSPLILPTFGVPLIVVAAVVLVVAGYNSQQIAPVIGLLGTIAGYLVGKDGALVSAARAQQERPRSSIGAPADSEERKESNAEEPKAESK